MNALESIVYDPPHAVDMSVCLQSPSRRLVPVSSGIICKKSAFRSSYRAEVHLTLWANHQTATFLRATVDSLDDINQLLLILQHPVQLVVVASTKIAHHMFVAEEEHEGDWVVKFIPNLCS
jgi:hypothetical protein